MLNDGPKRKGRFLKKSSKVMEKVALSDFAFGELDADGSVTPDNSVRSIIHAKYHAQHELAKAVVKPKTFEDDLMPHQQRRPVIFPLDFTKDWERSRKLSKDRREHRDDEDYEFEAQLGTAIPEDEDEAHREPEAAAAPESAPPARTHAPTTQVSAPLDGPIEKAPYASMDAVSQAIKNLHTDQFIPQVAPPSASGVTSTTDVPVDPEQATSDTYRQRLTDESAAKALSAAAADLSAKARSAAAEAAQKAFEEAREQGRQEGLDAGFKEGYAQGEEKAEIAARQHAAALFGKVGELIQEFAGLKHEILQNVQENFYELSQAMAEALLKREFSIRPEAFVTVLRKAIDEAVEPGKFKIKVHPDTFAAVEAVAPKDIQAALQKDPALEPGDFRIESTLSVVDVNIRTMLKDLLDQADISLFDDGKNEKAG